MTCRFARSGPPCGRGLPLFSFPREKGRGFTLIELLAVMAIMALMLGLAAVAFAPKEGRAARVARDLVSAQLNRARSHAIASGVPTAVVFSPYDAGPPESRGRSMALAEVKAAGAGSGSYEVARVLARWEDLPKGQFFVTRALARRDGATVMDGAETLSLAQGGENVSGPYVLFSSRGTVLYPQGTKVEICLAPAILQNGAPRLTGKNQDGAAVDVIGVSRLSGRVRIINELNP